MSTPAGAANAAAGERTWTILELLRWTTKHFSEVGIESARLDAECLLAFALEITRLDLYLQFEKSATAAERQRLRELVRRRAAERVPVALLTGRKEFWSLNLEVSHEVLVPRPETEVLVSAALDRLPEAEAEYRVLDLGTGSGAIALALASERPKARVVATDISSSALQIARQNAEQLRLYERVELREGELFDPVRGESFDLVVSNPPYVERSRQEQLPPELAHEPEVALFGGDDGFAVLRPLVAGVGELLVPGGWAVVEIGEGQDQVVAQWFRDAGLEAIQIHHDLARRPRAVAGRRKATNLSGED